MNDKTQPPVPDDLTKPIDDASQQLDSTIENVSNLPATLGQTIEDGLNTAEQKLDDFIGGIDKFLGKF